MRGDGEEGGVMRGDGEEGGVMREEMGRKEG